MVRWLALILMLVMANRAFAQDDLPPRRPIAPDPLFDFSDPNDDPQPRRWPQPYALTRNDDRAPRYRAWWYPERPVRGQPTTLGFVRQELDVPFPILLEDRDILAGSFQIKNMLFQTQAVLPDSGLLDTERRFPSNLWDINIGVAYIHRFDNGWSAGIIPRFGSPSDKPFNSLREMSISAIGFVRVPAAYEGDFWNFSLFYQPNGQVPFPLPGISYDWNPDEDLKMSIGIPFSIMWRPALDWRVDFSYRPLTQITSRVSWEARPGFRIYGGFDWDSEGYFLTGRPERRDRFFVQEKRIIGGVRFDIAERLSLDLSGGYAFDRSFGAGRNPLHYKYDRVDVASGGFLSAWLLIPF